MSVSDYRKAIDQNDVIKQALWEIELEIFEQEVIKEKARIRAKRAWFPWRIKIVKVT